jgi:hypothetical protein
MTTSNRVTKHSSHPTKKALNGAPIARAKVIHRAPSAAALLRSTSPHMRTIGAAAAATGIVAGASVLMRKPLSRALRQSVRAAASAGTRLGRTTQRATSNLLVTVGLRRRSFFSRMWPELGALAGVLAAAGTTLIVWRGLRLGAMTSESPLTPSPSREHAEENVDRASPEAQNPLDSEGVRHAQ